MQKKTLHFQKISAKKIPLKSMSPKPSLTAFLKCNQCGAYLRYQTSSRRVKNNPSFRYGYYECPKRKIGTCSAPIIRKDKLA
jgi:hypothetical protein